VTEWHENSLKTAEIERDKARLAVEHAKVGVALEHEKVNLDHEETLRVQAKYDQLAVASRYAWTTVLRCFAIACAAAVVSLALWRLT